MSVFKEEPLEKLASFSYGYTDTAKDSGSHRFIRITDITDRGLLKESDQKFIDFDNSDERYVVQDKDLLVARTGGTFGKTLMYHGNTPAVYASFLIKIELNEKKVIPEFYFHFSQSDQYWYQANNLVLCGGQPQFNANVLKEVVMPIPPLPEQKAIADLLSTWDSAIEKTERLIAAKEKALKGEIQGIMSEEAISRSGWKVVELGKIFSEVTEKVGEKNLMPHSISAGIGFVSHEDKWGKDISGSQYTNYTHLKAGEFAYNKGNSKRYQQGCVYLLKEGEICVPNVFISFKPKNEKVVPEFYAHYFIADYHARELKKYITSGARADGLLNLNKKDFFKIRVPFPSSDEQRKIASFMESSQKEIDLLKTLAEKYKEQKRGLMQKLLTGEWRVKVA